MNAEISHFKYGLFKYILSHKSCVTYYVFNILYIVNICYILYVIHL